MPKTEKVGLRSRPPDRPKIVIGAITMTDNRNDQMSEPPLLNSLKASPKTAKNAALRELGHFLFHSEESMGT